MRVGVGNGLRGRLCGKALALNTGCNLAGVGFAALNKVAVCAVGAALNGVAVGVVEHADAVVERGHSGLGAGVGALAAAAGPRLAVHQDLVAVREAVELLADIVHGGGVMQRHEVKAEAVDVIFFRPISAGIYHILAEHLLVGGGLVAAAGAVGIGCAAGHSVVVARNGFAEAGAVGQIGVVVNNVHNNGDASVVERLHQLLELLDPDVAVIGVGGVGAFGNVVVDRVVAPVAVGGGGGDCLVDGAEVINRLELNGVDAVLDEIIHAGGHGACLTVERGAALGKGKISALVLLADAGIGGDGEVTHMCFPNDGSGGAALENMVVGVPAIGVGGIEVNDHGTVAVDADSL